MSLKHAARCAFRDVLQEIDPTNIRRPAFKDMPVKKESASAETDDFEVACWWNGSRYEGQVSLYKSGAYCVCIRIVLTTDGYKYPHSWHWGNLHYSSDPITGWTSMTDDEIKIAARRICHTSKSDQEVKDRLRDELGYPYGAAVTSTSHGPMRMTMVMIHGPRGNTISV